MKAAILTEANAQVASGHLLECIELVQELRHSGHEAMLIINEDMQPELKGRIMFPYWEYPVPASDRVPEIAELANDFGADLLIMNLRRAEDSFLMALKAAFAGIDSKKVPKLVCIDELGHRTLHADIIINPMIDSYYWDYPDTACLKYCGQQYLILPASLQGYASKTKEIHEEIQEVTVSMGGVDRRGTTLKLAEWLPDILPRTRVNLVCGGGFPYGKELDGLVSGMKNVRVYHNIDFLHRLFYESDLAFCAGGNTLHELAAIGTPTVVIPSMPHELRNGHCFQEKGFGITIDRWEDIAKQDIVNAVFGLHEKNLRAKMCGAGKKIVDGRGGSRTLSILCCIE